MANYTKGCETKRRLIQLTHNWLLKNDNSTPTVRNLANENGRSAPALYRHFKSLEYLVVVSSVKFLKKYIDEYSRLLDSEKNPMEIYIEGWKLFNGYAFTRPDIYYRLFWGQYNNEFASAIQEYFELFPFSVSEKYPAYFETLFNNANIHERDLWVLRRAVRRGIISEEDAGYFSKTTPLIAQGMLNGCIELKPESRELAETECNYLLEKNLERSKFKSFHQMDKQ